MSQHFKTSLDYMRRAPFQALAAITVLTVTFFIATLLSILVYASSQVINYFETRPQVIAFLKNDATVEDISALQRKLNSDQRIKDVSYISKEQALEIYKEATADNPLLSELVSPSIFPASLEFSVLDLSDANQIVEEVKTESVVESVGFTASLGDQQSLNDVVNRLKTITLYLRLGGSTLIAIMGLSSFLVLLVVVGMRITTRRHEIESLDAIGATASFIRAPIVIEAINYAVIGVLAGWLMALILLLYLTPSIISYFGEIPVLPRQTISFFLLFGAILGGELVIGLLIALGGSYLAVARARNK